MKTEMDQLKENAEREFAMQKMEALKAYIVVLDATIDAKRALHMRSSSMEMCTAALSIGTIFTHEWIHTLAFNLFLFVMFRNWVFIYPQLTKAVSEMLGCIKTLEVLGMINEDDGPKRRKKIRQKGVSWVQLAWEALKTKKRNEAFA